MTMTVALKIVEAACEELEDGTLWLYGREDQAAEMRRIHAQIKSLTVQLNDMKREVRSEVRELVDERRARGQHIETVKIDMGDEKPVEIVMKSQWKAVPPEGLPEAAEPLFREIVSVKVDPDVGYDDLEAFLGEDGWRRLQSVATVGARVQPIKDYQKKRFVAHRRMGPAAASWLDSYEADAQCSYAVVLG
jgi:hypothetical protein